MVSSCGIMKVAQPRLGSKVVTIRRDVHWVHHLSAHWLHDKCPSVLDRRFGIRKGYGIAVIDRSKVDMESTLHRFCV